MTKIWPTNLLLGRKESYYEQHEFKKGQDLEVAVMVSSSHMKLLLKTVQGSDDDGEIKESQEINGEQGKYKSRQTVYAKRIVLGKTVVKNLYRGIVCRV